MEVPTLPEDLLTRDFFELGVINEVGLHEAGIKPLLPPSWVVEGRRKSHGKEIRFPRFRNLPKAKRILPIFLDNECHSIGEIKILMGTKDILPEIDLLLRLRLIVRCAQRDKFRIAAAKDHRPTPIADQLEFAKYLQMWGAPHVMADPEVHAMITQMLAMRLGIGPRPDPVVLCHQLEAQDPAVSGAYARLWPRYAALRTHLGYVDRVPT